jgi:hypothetical protein
MFADKAVNKEVKPNTNTGVTLLQVGLGTGQDRTGFDRPELRIFFRPTAYNVLFFSDWPVTV